MPTKRSIVVCVVLGASLSNARADEENPVTAPVNPTAPAASVGEGVDQMTLPKGRLLLDAFLQASLSSGAVFKPFSITPDVWYGATPELTLGLVHSTLGATGFMGAFGQVGGDSLCLSGTSGNCEDVYRNVGVDARYGFMKGTTALAFDGGLFVNRFSPFQLALKVGLAGRFESGKIAIEFMPNLFFGLTNREVTQGMPPNQTVLVNKEFLDLPITFFYKATPQLALSLQSGVILPLENTGDLYQVPVSIGGHYRVNDSLTVTLAFSLPLLLGGSSYKPAMGTDETGFNSRALILGGAYAF